MGNLAPSPKPPLCSYKESKSFWRWWPFPGVEPTALWERVVFASKMNNPSMVLILKIQAGSTRPAPSRSCLKARHHVQRGTERLRPRPGLRGCPVTLLLPTRIRPSSASDPSPVPRLP